MHRNFFYLLLLLSNTLHSCAQVVNLDSIISAQMQTKHSPGMSAMIIKHGKPLWAHQYGFARLEDSIPVTANTAFMLASISKTIMSVALMNVQENGGFELDDDINDYLPFSIFIPDYPDSIITFRELLTHTSSFKDNWNILDTIYVHGDSPTSLGDFMKGYFKEGGVNYDANKNFYSVPPGTHYHYCNEGAALCGYLVELITGIPFDQYCNDSIFKPLCMDQTSWFLSGLDSNTIAMPYEWQNNTYHAQGYYGYPDYPDGQLRTTANSLAKFLSMFMNYGELNGVRILDSATVAEMLTVQFPQVENTQGLIWYQANFGDRTCWGHDGGDSGVSTNLYFSPQDSTGIILLSNGGNFYSCSVIDAMFDYAENLQPSDSFQCDLATVSTTIPNNKTIHLLPNPFSDELIISFPYAEEFSLLILDVAGKVIFKTDALKNGISLETKSWPLGTYLIKLQGENQTISEKAMKQ